MTNIKRREIHFINIAKSIYKNRYIYSNINYINAITPINIICRIHGQFKMRPNDHTSGKQNCPKCLLISRGRKRKMSHSEFIKKSTKIHNSEYDYSRTIYKNMKTKIIIICKQHGEFRQSPEKHIIGRGCPICGKTKGGTQIKEFFKFQKHYNKFKGLLYFIKMSNNNEVFYKIGVTSTTIKSRFSGYKNYNIKTIKEKEMLLGDAYIEEHKFKKI